MSEGFARVYNILALPSHVLSSGITALEVNELKSCHFPLVTMGLRRSLLLAVALAASAVNCAPTKFEDRQAPAGVPDYVLNYGMLGLTSLSHCTRTNRTLKLALITA